MIISYETVKYVSIQDSRLGILRYSLIIIIIFYVVYIEIYANGGYLINETIHGVIRMTLQQPTMNHCDPFMNNNYNNNEMKNISFCYNNFRPLYELSYCQQYYNNNNTTTNDSFVSSLPSSSNNIYQSNTTSYYKGNIYPCQYYEAINAQVITETSIVILTRIKVLEQQLICGENNNDDETTTTTTCPTTYETISSSSTTNTSTVQPFYIAQSEDFTVLLDHAVTASKLCTNYNNNNQNNNKNNNKNTYTCSSLSSQYNGRLYTNNIELCQLYYQYAYTSVTGTERITIYDSNNTNSSIERNDMITSCYIEPNVTRKANLDFFSIDTLLRAGGIHSLDDCINNDDDMTTVNDDDDNTNTTTCTTYRDNGVTIIMNIIWNDFILYHGMTQQPYYYYRVHVLYNQPYKTTIPYYNQYRTNRTIVIGHGIRIAIVISGEFHHFDWMTFIITITTALGLLAIATTIVDYLMIYILPEKDIYTKAKYETPNDNNVIVEVPVPNLPIPQFIPFHTTSPRNEQNIIDNHHNNNNIATSNNNENLNTNDDNTLLEPLLLSNNDNKPVST